MLLFIIAFNDNFVYLYRGAHKYYAFCDMEGNENCMKCRATIKDDQAYKCDSCLQRIHKECSGMSASEAKCMPLQRRLLLFVCEDCRGLLARMPYMIKMLEEIRKDIDILKHNDSAGDKTQRSFADIVRHMPGENRSSNLPTLVVRPKSQQTAAKTRRDIESGVDPAKLKVGIKNLRNTKNGNVVIRCSTREDVELLKEATEQSLKGDYTVEETKLRSPRVKVVNYNAGKNKDEIEESLRKQNSWITLEDQLHVTYIGKNRNRDTSTVFIEVSPGLFSKMISFKKVYIGWERYPVFEDLDIMRCFKCQGFYHKGGSCDKKQKCGKCAGEHDTRECRSQIKKCVNCVSANERFRTQYAIEHTTSDPGCPSVKYHTEILKSRINYG